MLSFSIDKQTLIRLDNQKVVSDSYNYLYAYFNFSSDWNDVNKNAIFVSDNKPYMMPIINGLCLVPWESMDSGIFTVSGYGFSDSKRITTNAITISVDEFVEVPESLPSPPPTPTDYETYVELVNNALKQINDLSNEAKQTLEQAQQYNEQSQQAATNAANSASQAESSSQIAQNSAQSASDSANKAEQAVSTAGFASFNIDDVGHLILTKTTNIEDNVNFQIVDDMNLEVTISG